MGWNVDGSNAKQFDYGGRLECNEHGRDRVGIVTVPGYHFLEAARNKRLPKKRVGVGDKWDIYAVYGSGRSD